MKNSGNEIVISPLAVLLPVVLHVVFPRELLSTEVTREGDCTMDHHMPGIVVARDQFEAGWADPVLFPNSHFLLQMRGRICGGGGRTWSGLSDGSIGRRQR